MKRILRCPRAVRDLLELLPAEWTAPVDAASLAELPTEFIGRQGDKRFADLCWLVGGDGDGPVIVLIENQSAPDARMPARMMARVGLLYETLGDGARGARGRFPPMLPVVVYTGHRPWRAPDDLTGLVRTPTARRLPWLDGRRYLRVDLREVAAQYSGSANRIVALARLTFAESAFAAGRLLADLPQWLDFEEEDEVRLYQCHLDWYYANAPRLRPRGWNPGRDRNLEELMAEQSILERNTERWLKRYRRDVFAEGLAEGLAEGHAEGHAEGQATGRREMLVRQAARRFGGDIGSRLGAKLEHVADPGLLDRVGDLIVDCETGEQLLGNIDGAGTRPS